MMNRTEEFRRLVKEYEAEMITRQKSSYSRSREKSLGERNPLLTSKEYTLEAFNILTHVRTLFRMLNNIKWPYLNVNSGVATCATRQPSRYFDFEGKDQWHEIRYLTNEERHQIDIQARVILSRCADKVKEMEALERRRTELLSKQTNTVLRLLPSRLTRDISSDSSEFVAAHHAGITWFLNKRLAEVSQVQKEMQEERIQRQMERTKTLGSAAAREADELERLPPGSQSRQGGWLNNIGGSSALASTLASTLTGSTPVNSAGSFTTVPPEEDKQSLMLDEDIEDMELTTSQVLQFESENASILRSMQDNLASVQLAESRLVDISTLQMELIAHLTRQTEITEQLYEDVIVTSSAVEKGNIQLRDAKRRGKDGRVFLLFFFIGASLALLFIHLY